MQFTISSDEIKHFILSNASKEEAISFFLKKVKVPFDNLEREHKALMDCQDDYELLQQIYVIENYYYSNNILDV